MKIQVLMAGVLLCALFFWKALQDRKKDREKLKQKLGSEWGKPVRVEYSDEIWNHIASFYRGNKNETSVDEITWNDLNLSAVYGQMNHTRTSAGEMMLFYMLRTPVFHEQELKRRERLVSGIQKREQERQALEEALFEIGKTDRFSVYEYLLKIKDLKTFSQIPHLFCAGLLLAGTVLLFFLPVWYLLVYSGILLFNTFLYFYEKGKHIREISLFHFIFHLLRGCEAVSAVSFPELAEEIGTIKELAGRFRKYRRFHFLVAGGEGMSGNVFDSIMDYVRILFHVDLIKISTMTKETKKYESEILQLFEKTGELDAMLSVASYREFLGEYVVPEFLDVERNPLPEKEQHRMEAQNPGGVRLHVEGLYHPLVKEPVKNSIIMDRPVLLTGSNASGKSTFLKAAALGILFAQTIHTVAAKKYKAPFYRVYSSMALRDNILAKESYFIVEIKSLKRILDAEHASNIPVFCFVDEILRGTNTVERISASSVLLEFLAGRQVMCMAATHDIELSRMLEGRFENYHFEEQVEKGDVLFDYRLKKGAAKSRNAILLMESLGFGQALTERAQQRAENFLKTGEWH